MNEGPVEAALASTGATPRRIGLREAFGMRGSAPEPEAAAMSSAELLPGLLDGATRALLGRDALAGEHEAIAQALGQAGPGIDVADLTQRVLDSVLAAQPPALLEPGAERLGDEALFASIVNAIFRGLLGREAGEEGVAIWKAQAYQRFLDGSVEDFIAFFVTMVVRSPEWVHRVLSDQARDMRAGFLPRDGVELTGHISLGCTGYTSALFRRYNLKRWSGPFDWLSANPAIIRDIIADDFRGFLDPDSWRTIPAEDRPDGRFYQCHHPGLESRHGAACILHNADMRATEGLAYMTRCVDRFRQSMRGLASKIVLQVAQEGADPGRDFQRTARALEEIGRSFQFVMVSLLPDHTSAPFPEVEPAGMEGRHRLLRVRMLGPIIGVDAVDMLDDLVLLRAALAAPGLE